MPKLADMRRASANLLAAPFIRLLAASRVSPNTLSWFGLLLSLTTAALVVTSHLLAGGIMVLLSGGFDMLDGALARRTNQVTRFGAILDSTLDRVSEAVLLLGILFLFLVTGENSSLFWPMNRQWSILLLALVMVSTPMVSYLRARAETAGLDCRLGIFTRPERVIMLALGLLLGRMFIALAVIALLSLVTCGQRFYFIWRKTRNESPL